MWQCRQLTSGTEEGIYHWHGYYDLPLFDHKSRFLLAYQARFQGRRPLPDDTVKVGIVDLEDGCRWSELGESLAWNWQQGAMAQWIPGTHRIIWNDREGERFVSRIYDLESGSRTTLPYPVYAISPYADTALTIDFSRVTDLQPGYGYAGLKEPDHRIKRPHDDGVWSVDLNSGKGRLILSLHDAIRYTEPGRPYKKLFDRWLNPYTYWFNHVKFSPDGKRFTVKYRYCIPGSRMFRTHSLTCGQDGTGCRYLADETSHVMWKDPRRLYLWRKKGLFLFEDAEEGGRVIRQIAPGIIRNNSHVRYMPGSETQLIYDEPYREKIPLYYYDEQTGERGMIAEFSGHRPSLGEFRCDLHQCPSPDGRKILVSSLRDGGRQLYLLEK